jgi:hypothetical protein
MKIQSPLCGVLTDSDGIFKSHKKRAAIANKLKPLWVPRARIKTNTIFEQNLSFSSFSTPLLSAAFHRRITRSVIKSWQSVTNGSALLIETPQVS